MKRVRILLSLLFIAFLWGCQTEPTHSYLPLSSTYTISSRGENGIQSLPIGSEILLNANGGIVLDNEIFTYNGTEWTNGQNYRWTNAQEETSLVALYPTYSNNAYTDENLYSKGELEDILIAQTTLSGDKTVLLQFKHLFSLLTLYFDDTLTSNLQEVALSVPIKVEEINPKEGSYSLIHETQIVRQNNNGSNTYSFILPPAEECTLTLLLTLTDNTIHEVHLTPHTFQSGMSYECHVSQYDSRPGIRNAADLIAFSQLINGTYKGNHTLSDFGELIDGKMVYRLLNDIILTEEECSLLQPIGFKKDKAFTETFDGRGHTITGYIIPDDGYDSNYIGLFGIIDEEAIVTDLHLIAVQNTETTTYEYVGGIAGKNTGIIQNCSVQDSQFNSRNNGNTTGGICGSFGGYIINCYTTNNTYYRKKGGKTGDIAGDTNGFILNCYSYKNKHSIGSYDNAYSGGIAGLCNNGHIYNCYVYKTPSKNLPTDWGALVGVYNGNYLPQIKNFFYNTENTYGNNHAHNNPEGTQIYDTDFKIDGTHISTLLNNWIDTIGKESYSNYTFKRWKVADDGSACFE